MNDSQYSNDEERNTLELEADAEEYINNAHLRKEWRNGTQKEWK